MTPILLQEFFISNENTSIVIDYYKYRELIDLIGFELFNKTCQDNSITVIIGIHNIKGN